MKKLIFLIICIVTITISYLSSENNTQGKEEQFQLVSANIEALARNENGQEDYWCCGNTKTCASGPGYEIKGQLKEKPCN